MQLSLRRRTNTLFHRFAEEQPLVSEANQQQASLARIEADDPADCTAFFAQRPPRHGVWRAMSEQPADQPSPVIKLRLERLDSIPTEPVQDVPASRSRSLFFFFFLLPFFCPPSSRLLASSTRGEDRFPACSDPPSSSLSVASSSSGSGKRAHFGY
ncbi:hypothetical protein CGRA01v4_09280 [Colletotrichum graminicola]|nr:hypothetical protein CGRA01v4_09280 [Colletotrichum graminicola]